MKFIKYFFMILSVSLTVLQVACTDALDKSPDGNMTMEDVLSDPNKVESLLNACYNQIPQKGYRYFWYDPVVVALTDDAYSSEENQGLAIGNLYNDNTSASYHPMIDTGDSQGGNVFDYWNRYWAQIRLCSQFLENIDKAAVRNEADRGRFKAEAHVLRAFFYSELVKWFGKVPILEETVPFDTDFSSMTRASVYDVAKFIESDCDAAINSPDLPWRITVASDAMRVTKALAWSLKAKMMLFAASPLHNENRNHWDEAYQICKDAVRELRAQGYELFKTCTNEALYGTYGAQAYHQLACENADYSATPRDRETIWQHRLGQTTVFYHGYIGSNMDYTFRCGTCPTQELVDAYETIDGVPVLNLSQPYLDEFHREPNYNPANTLYNPDAPYENRDPRMEASVMHNGSKLIHQNGVEWTIETFIGGRHELNLNPFVREYTRTGYFQRKMTTPTSSGTNQVLNALWKFHRFGELLLDFAEAACEANHLDEAKAAADEVRARSSMPPLPAGLSQDEMRLRIHNERRVELAWEEHRYFDLRRWQKPDGDLSATCKWFTAMQITKNADDSFTYERVSISNNPRGGWQNKDLLLPLPLADCSRLEPLTGVKWQNPGW